MKQLLVFTVLVVASSLGSGCKPSVVSDSAAVAVAGDASPAVISNSSSADLSMHALAAQDAAAAAANVAAASSAEVPVDVTSALGLLNKILGLNN